MPPRHPQIADALGRVRAVIGHARQRFELSRGQPLRLLVACSGGRDSVALLGLLVMISTRDRLVLTVGHVDHGLREGSAAEAKHVQALARSLDVECCVTTPSIDADRPGLAARARQARHAALRSMQGNAAAHAIALAHTATDQAETVLIHLARGAGLEGLAGMGRVEDNVVRPLLDLTRAQTTSLCEHLKLRFVDDPTNVDPAHLRVRVRTTVLPALRSDRGGVESSIAAVADLARETEDALGHWVARALVERRDGNAHRVDGWRDLPRGFRTRWLRAWLLQHEVVTDAIGRRVVGSIDAGIVHGGTKRWDLAGAYVQLEDRRLRLTHVDPTRTPPKTTK